MMAAGPDGDADANANDMNVYIIWSQRKRPTTSPTTAATTTAMIDENDGSRTSRRRRRWKNEKNVFKTMQNGPKTIQNGLKTIQKRLKISSKTAEQERCIIGYMYRCLCWCACWCSWHSAPHRKLISRLCIVAGGRHASNRDIIWCQCGAVAPSHLALPANQILARQSIQKQFLFRVSMAMNFRKGHRKFIQDTVL